VVVVVVGVVVVFVVGVGVDGVVTTEDPQPANVNKAMDKIAPKTINFFMGGIKKIKSNI
jgi:hypothetical protein